MTARLDAATVLDALADLIADRVADRMSGRASSAALRPLRDVAASLGWTPRHLREFCAIHSVPVAGTRKASLVDGPALDRALASTVRPGRTPAPRRAAPRPERTPDAEFDSDDLETFARSGVRVAARPTGSTR